MINGKIKVWLPAIRAGSGADVYTQRLARALEHHGMVVEISWFPLRFEPVPFLLKNISPPPGTDIVFANSWNAFAFKRAGLPLVVIEHHCVFDPAFRPYQSMTQDLYHRFLIKPFAMLSFRVANAIIAVSDFTARSLRQNAGLTNVEVIYNWVDTDIFCPPTENRRIGGPFRLLYIGNPSRRKGADLLATIIRKLGAGFELHFTAGLKTENMACSQTNMVRLGRLSNEQLICAYQECDALLFPSRFEGFGYAALEAMACGKPVITSNNTALPEVVVDGVTGILCDTDDTEAFANACRLLADDPESCSLMGSAGRQRAIDLFTESTALKLYLDLIDGLVAKRG
jgi:starch synthase